MRDNYLKIIDYFQSIDHSSLATSQDVVGSSSRYNVFSITVYAIIAKGAHLAVC